MDFSFSLFFKLYCFYIYLHVYTLFWPLLPTPQGSTFFVNLLSHIKQKFFFKMKMGWVLDEIYLKVALQDGHW
jgi:hypothetical protein